jgi:hypothetical protein
VAGFKKRQMKMMRKGGGGSGYSAGNLCSGQVMLSWSDVDHKGSVGESMSGCSEKERKMNEMQFPPIFIFMSDACDWTLS